ncbi:MAG TPA: DUF4386 domain-containing protein [Thermoanaerobaculia bacterium]|nr:DUF4386 domain-containing protein [Thermoanaerobaculia bacterium]
MPASTARTARLAGLLYVLSSIPGAYAWIYVGGRIVVKDDAAATAERIRASEALFRAGIAGELVGMTLFVFVALMLYRLFRPVAEGSALAMFVLILISIPITLVGVVGEVAALDFAGVAGRAHYLSAFDPRQRDALAYLGMTLHLDAIRVAQIFWGLWLFPFGVCVIRSRFIPRFLGALLVLAGIGNLAEPVAQLVLPQYAGALSVVGKLTLCELPIILWLLTVGARPRREAVRAQA